MNWFLFAVCVSIGVVNVLSGCIDGHGHGLEEEKKDLKDFEWIGKDLKFKMDYGMDKELLDKKGLSGDAVGFDHAHHLSGEHNERSLKKLRSMLGEDFKIEDLSEKDLKALSSFMEHLSSEDRGELFAKKEKEPFGKDEVQSFKSVEKSETLKEKSPLDSLFDAEDTSLYESVFHRAKTQDASNYYRGSDQMLHKKLEEMKDLHEEDPYFSDEDKAYFKGVSGDEKMVPHEMGEKGLEVDALKKFMKLISDAAHHEEGAALLKEIIDQPMDEKSMEEIFKELAKKLYSEKGIGMGDHDMKSMGHDIHLKEGAHALGKDLVYDEILKKEEGKIYDEEKFYDGVKKFKTADFDEHSKLAHGIYEGINPDEAAKKSKVGAKDEVHDILKEEKYYITGGTTAYEKARDQAHVDSKVPPSLDESSKAIDTHKILSEEEAKKVYRGEESLLGKDKAVRDTKFAYGEDTRKSMVNHGIGEEITGEKKLIDGSMKGKEGFGFGLAEDHLMKGHHMKGVDESISVDKPHHGPMDLKKKFVNFLKRMLRMKKCHLVTMPPAELLGIVDCISKSKNPSICEKFALCEKKRPLQVILAQEKCQMEIVGGEVKRCTTYEPLFPSREIPLKIFKCVAKNIVELSPEEKKQMIDFEECARQVKVESCGRIPWG